MYASTIRGLVLASLALLTGACGTSDETVADDENWRAVQDYMALDAAWHKESAKDRGPHPDIAQAVAAARTIVGDAAHPRFVDAATFLVEHPEGLSETADEDMALGLVKLTEHVGADWEEVTSFNERQAESTMRYLQGQPSALQAMVAAAEIVEVDGHEKRQQAAEFLLRNSHTRGIPDEVVAKGVQTLLDHFPEYDGWHEVLGYNVAMDLSSDLLETIVARTAEPVHKATVRYHLAANLIEQANGWATLADERKRVRMRARRAIAGLSEGVAEEEFPQRRFAADGTMLTGTFADVEAELLFRLDHATAGGTLPEAAGKRLDGEQENLAAYAGKVVLVDFWATWCVPCIQALPALRELHGELPAARFALLSISVDDELETVTDFMQEEAMPWSNWHVGSASEVAQAWNIRAFPTYILVDPQGTILVRTNRLDERLIELAKASAATA